MEVRLYELGQVTDEKLEFAVISAVFKDKWILVKHKERDTWEIPGGHREKNEDINRTSSRELVEETGARLFSIEPICDYSVASNGKSRFGRLFYCEVQELGELPNMEIREVELFDKLPKNLTYPLILPYLHDKALLYRKNQQ